MCQREMMGDRSTESNHGDCSSAGVIEKVSADELAALNRRACTLAITNHLNLRIAGAVNGTVTADLSPIEPCHKGGMEADAINGGIILCLLDAVIISAGMLQFPHRRGATIEMAVRFIKPVHPDRFRAIGKPIRRVGRVAFLEGRIVDVHGGCRVAATGAVAML